MTLVGHFGAVRTHRRMRCPLLDRLPTFRRRVAGGGPVLASPRPARLDEVRVRGAGSAADAEVVAGPTSPLTGKRWRSAAVADERLSVREEADRRRFVPTTARPGK